MRITFYSHSTIYIEIDSINILVDPFFSGNPIIDSNIRYKLNPHYILITHAHYDHISDIEDIAKKTSAVLVSNYEIANYFYKKGLETISINYGSFINLKFGKLKYVYALHSSSFPDGSYGGNPGGFIINNKNKNIYISGDTALYGDMKIISKYINLDILILPIGGIFTMDYLEAIEASELLNCNKILGVHYDTYPSITINHSIVKNSFLEKKKDLILLKKEEYIEI